MDEGDLAVALVDPPEVAGDLRSRSYVVDHVAPGSSVERRLAVGNGTSSPLDVRLYVGDAKVVDHRLVPGDGTGDGELARWTTITPGPVLPVPADGHATADVRIDVPAGAEPGERFGVVWAELPGGTSGSTTVVGRVGVRIYLSVGPGSDPAPDVRARTIAVDDGGAIVVDVANEGRRSADVGGVVELDVEGGTRSEPLDAGITLEAGDEVALATTPMEALTGLEAATVRLVVNGIERTYRAELDGDAGGGPVPLALVDATSAGEGGDGGGEGPWAVVAAAALAVAAVLIARSRPSRRSGGPGPRGRAPRS